MKIWVGKVENCEGKCWEKCEGNKNFGEAEGNYSERRRGKN